MREAFIRPVSERDKKSLAALVAGPVLSPGDAGYANETSTINLSVVHQPALIVGAASAGDVQAAVRFAGAHELPVGVLSTGHGPSVRIKGGVLITTRRMTGVAIDPVAKTARVEAGVRWRQVADEAAAWGLAPLAGSAPTVGVIGYILGGGLSVTMGRASGWAADHVHSLDVVTADGELRHASRDSERDLFWALRGGKSNFGVVTALELALFPVTRLYAGGLFFSGEDTAMVLASYQLFTTQVPDELMSSVALLRMPDISSVPEFMRGRLTVNIRISYLGSQTDGEKLIAPLRAAAPTLLDTVTERPFTEFGEIAPGPLEPMSTVEQFALLRELSPSTVAALFEVGGPGADTPINVIEIRHLGGALNRRQATADSAAGALDAAFLLFTSTIVPPGQGDQRRRSGLELISQLRPWLQEQKHANFLAPSDAAPEQTRKAFNDRSYKRLQSIKANVDPHNLFRFNHNIPPGHS